MGGTAGRSSEGIVCSSPSHQGLGGIRSYDELIGGSGSLQLIRVGATGALIGAVYTLEFIDRGTECTRSYELHGVNRDFEHTAINRGYKPTGVHRSYKAGVNRNYELTSGRGGREEQRGHVSGWRGRVVGGAAEEQRGHVSGWGGRVVGGCGILD